MHHRYYGEVLPYLEVSKQEEAEEITENVEMPEITGMDLDEAKKTLKELGLEVEIVGEGETVIDQLPKKGIQINATTKVTIYCN